MFCFRFIDYQIYPRNSHFSPPDPSLKILKIEVENEQDDGDELDINKETSEFGVILKLVGNIGERPPDLTMVIFTGSSPLSSIPIYKPTLLTGMLFATNPVVIGSINEFAGDLPVLAGLCV
ncbi:hypothetical protein QVD17_11549 [Tagetes erecta]|uniref:Uncharacterized protein n=1 Tax=Tagetes erecta TaxID=13708 RepID=A0AAD8KY69_TARER|nr:hypothetical protein QVD17_11549 [Tagetes erecta]